MDFSVAIIVAILLLYLGIQLILNASAGRELVVKYYRRFPSLYRLFFFGDWIERRPGLHIWMIRFGGVWFILMALALFFATVLPPA